MIRPTRTSNFYPRPPRGGRLCSFEVLYKAYLISIHALREEGDEGHREAVLPASISIHALREEGDAVQSRAVSLSNNFYPRPPRGGRPAAQPSCSRSCYFYPRPPRGGRRQRAGLGVHLIAISIHALREEGDRLSCPNPIQPRYFYPRPPRGGRPVPAEFQGLRLGYFYPRPPRGGRRPANGAMLTSGPISIHALREEGDAVAALAEVILDAISIHALREEGDSALLKWKPLCRNFYPRPPRGGRPGVFVPQRDSAQFLSTPSARRATTIKVVKNQHFGDFYPRPPRGGRPCCGFC